MRIIDLIETIRAQGITLAVVGGKLAVDGPVELLSPELLATVRINKAKILLVIRAESMPRLLSPVEALEWESRFIQQARGMIRRATSDRNLADVLYRQFSGAWSVALCFNDADEQQAVNHAFAVLREAIDETRTQTLATARKAEVMA